MNRLLEKSHIRTFVGPDWTSDLPLATANDPPRAHLDTEQAGRIKAIPSISTGPPVTLAGSAPGFSGPPVAAVGARRYSSVVAANRPRLE